MLSLHRLCAPSSVRFCLTVLSMMAPLLLLCPTARAGTYMWQTTDANGHVTAQSPTYTVGQISFRGGPGPDQDRAYTWSYQGCGIRDGRGLATDISCSGANTATFTWQPDSTKSLATDPPPDQVIVKETTYARTIANGTVASPPTGSCSDGFGVSQGLIFGGNGQGGGVTLSGTRYSTQPGGQTVMLNPCEPTAHSANNSEESEVSYSANIYPVTINLTGTTPDSSNQNILVGQRCTATLNGIPSITGATVTYTWSPGGHALQSFVIAADQSTGTPTDFVSPNAATAQWYYSDLAGSQTVTCMATVTPPAGQGNSFSVTATTTVSLQRPTSELKVFPGAVELDNLNTHTYGPGYALYLGNTDTSRGRGITWQGHVNTPAAFVSQGSGKWFFLQITTPIASRAVSGQPLVQSINNGDEGLDKNEPYGSVAFFADDSTHESGDSPGFAIQDTYSKYVVADSYNTYVMYQPPTASGSDTILVPLVEIDWGWGANANIVKGSWKNFGTSDLGATVTQKQQVQTQHPKWTMIVTPPKMPDF